MSVSFFVSLETLALCCEPDERVCVLCIELMRKSLVLQVNLNGHSRRIFIFNTHHPESTLIFAPKLSKHCSNDEGESDVCIRGKIIEVVN